MARVFEGSNTFKFNWDKVSRGFWCRYPNPESKHVLTEDVIDRYVDDQGRLVTKRLMSKTNPCPKWAETFVSSRALYIVEESIVDPRKKRMETFTRNIGMQNYMTIEEKVVYTKSDLNSDWTQVERTAWIDSSFGYGLSGAVKAFGFDRFKKNTAKANRGFQIVLDAMFTPKDSLSMESLSTSNTFHPWLKKHFVEKAQLLKDRAAKSATAPLVVAAMSRS